MAKKTKTVPEQVKTSQTNSFTGGLNTDLHPLLQPNDTLTDCVNGTLITYNGNEYMLQNDMGNYALEGAELPIGYVPIGMKEHKGVVYIVSNNPQTNKTQIGSYPSPQHYSYNTSITEDASWYNTKMDLNDQERWYEFLRTGEWNANTQFNLTKYYYSNYLNTPITSIIGNYSEESKVYPTDKYVIEDKSLDCLQSVKYSLITELGKEVDLVYNNNDNIVGTVTNTDSGWLKRTVELYSDIEYNITIKENDNTTTVTNNVILNGLNPNTIRLGVLHTQTEQKMSTGDGSTTPTISRNIYINENSDLKFTRSIVVTSASISVSHEFCPLIAVQQYGNWHLIIYDNKKYIDSVESQSDEQISTLTAFQYDVNYNNETKQHNIDCFIKLSEIAYDLTIDYVLTHLQNSLNEIAESSICDGTTTMQQLDDDFLKFTITCNWPDNVNFILLKVEEKNKKFEFIRPVFKNVTRNAYKDKEDFSTIQFYAPKVNVPKTETADKIYYVHCLGNNISSSNLIISDTPTNPYTTTDPEGYYGVVQKSDCTFSLDNCNASSAIVNTVLELNDNSTIILNSQYEKINNNTIKCNVPTNLILNQFNSDNEDTDMYRYLGDRKYLIEEAVPKNSKDYARSITVKKVGGKQNNSVELSENSNKIKCTNTVSAQQYLTDTKFLFTNTEIYNNCNICGILYPYKTPKEIVGHVKIGVPYTEQEKLIQGVYNGKNIMCIACILSEEKETSFGNDQYRYIVPQPKGYFDKPITDKLEILALTRIYRYTNPNQIPSHKIKSGSKITTGIKYEISFTDLSIKYNGIESTKINDYIKTHYETTFDNFTYSNKITIGFPENESQITNSYIDYIEKVANVQLKQDTIVYSDTLTKNTFCIDKHDLNDKIITRLSNFADRLIIFDNNIKYLADENIEYSDKCAFGGNMGTGKDELEDPAEGNGWVSIAYPIKYLDDKRDLLMIKKDDDLYDWLSNNTYSIDSASLIFKNIYSQWLK